MANAALEEQAVSRAHRLGARLPVGVETLALRGTCEEALLSLQRNNACDAAGGSTFKLSTASQIGATAPGGDEAEVRTRRALLRSLTPVGGGAATAPPKTAPHSACDAVCDHRLMREAACVEEALASPQRSAGILRKGGLLAAAAAASAAAADAAAVIAAAAAKRAPRRAPCAAAGAAGPAAPPSPAVAAAAAAAAASPAAPHAAPAPALLGALLGTACDGGATPLFPPAVGAGATPDTMPNSFAVEPVLFPTEDGGAPPLAMARLASRFGVVAAT